MVGFNAGSFVKLHENLGCEILTFRRKIEKSEKSKFFFT